MKAGRELDALVAEKVMGWRREDKAMMHGIIQTVFVDTKTDHARSITCGCVEDFHPSEDISAAWLVVEKLGMVTIENATPHGPWSVGFTAHDCEGEPHWVHVEADTAPLAICLAALKACGVEVEKR